MSSSKVILVGAGPGDPGLVTVAGAAALARAETVVYDALASERLLDHAPPDAERIYVGKRAGDHTLTQNAINALLIERARAGHTVVRLKGGDPYVFGRGGEEALALAEAGVEFEVIPGITAGVAAAASAGIPVTHRALAGAVAFITGHEADDKADSALDWRALARFGGTLVFYMGTRNLPAICRNLTNHGLDPATPAAAVEWGTTPRQRTVTGTVETLPAEVEGAALAAPAVIVIGRVVELRETLAHFERRPLFGRRIVVTRARAQARRLSAALEALGAEAVEAPAIRIEPPEDEGPLRNALARLPEFHGAVLTSTNGVDAVFRVLEETGRDARAFAGLTVVAIGPATAARLAEHGIKADLVPETFTGAGVVEAVAAGVEWTGARVLCPRADIAPPELVEGLEGLGAKVTEVAAYRTVPDEAAGPALVERLDRGEVDWITFTSSSTVRYLLAAVPAKALVESGARLASIGPTTSGTLREAGFEPAAEADPHTIPALVDAIARAETETR